MLFLPVFKRNTYTTIKPNLTNPPSRENTREREKKETLQLTIWSSRRLIESHRAEVVYFFWPQVHGKFFFLLRASLILIFCLPEEKSNISCWKEAKRMKVGYSMA